MVITNMHRLVLAAFLCGCAAGSICAQEITPDDPGSILRGVEAAASAGQPRVIIPPGIYRLAADPASDVHLHFSNLKNLEIDATGATLVFTTPSKDSIIFEHCANTTFRGATLRRDPISFSQGKIIALSADQRAIDVQVSAGYRDPTDPSFGVASIFLNLYHGRQWANGIFPAPGAKLESLAPGRFRFHANRPATFGAGWTVGSSVTWRGRAGPDINLIDCQGMKMIGLTLENSAGYCMREQGGEGGNYYSYTVTYGPKPPGATEEPLMSCNAGAFQSSAVRHGPTLENCLFEGMNDDGIPMHGQYGLVMESTGTRMIVEVRHPPFCQAGDQLRLIDERGALAGEAKVVAAAVVPYHPTQPAPPDLHMFRDPTGADFEQLMLDRPADVKFGWLAANASANADGFVVRHCTVRSNRERGMLIKASDGVIENCTVEGSPRAGIVICPEMGAWDEADYARNLVIRHNVIRNVGGFHQPGSTQPGALTIAAYEHGRFVPLPGGHRNIVVEDNTFENIDGVNLLISSAEGVVVRNNRFIHPMWKPTDRGQAVGVDMQALIWLTECSGVTLSGNVVIDPGPELQKKVEVTPTAQGTGFDDGVTVQK